MKGRHPEALEAFWGGLGLVFVGTIDFSLQFCGTWVLMYVCLWGSECILGKCGGEF